MGVQHGPGLSPWGRQDDERAPEGERPRASGVLLGFVRYGIPLAIFLTGMVVIVAGGDSTALVAGFMFIGAAIAVLLLNVFFRIGVQGERERDAEVEARRYFDRHGRWPDDPR
jgi:Na+/melibiose symporter-like transporter